MTETIIRDSFTLNFASSMHKDIIQFFTKHQFCHKR